MKKWIAIYLSMILLIGLSGCSPSRTTLPSNSMDSPVSLRIYVTGHTMKIIYPDETEETQYPSVSVAGLGTNLGTANAKDGNIFYQTILDFSQQTGIPIDCTFFGTPQELMEQLKRDLIADTLPDVCFVDKQFNQDLETLVKQGYVEDLSPYLTDDLWDSEHYYQPLLDSCNIDGKQYGLPCLFNLPGMVTSEAFLSEIGVAQPSSDSTFEDYMQLFQETCLAMVEDRREALYEPTMVHSYYLAELLRLAGTDPRSPVTSDAVVDHVTDVMDSFYQQEFSLISGQEGKAYSDLRSNTNAKYNRFNLLPSVTQDYEIKPANLGILLDGGTNGSSFYSNFLAQAYFMDDYYQKHEMGSVVCGIPTEQAPHSYNASILNFGFMVNGTENPEAACSLLRYMMDQEYPLWYGFSVNKDNNEKMLNAAMETEYRLDVDLSLDYLGEKLGDPHTEALGVWLKPLREEVADTIRDLLDHVDFATLPNTSVADIYTQNWVAYWDGACTREEMKASIAKQIEALNS